MTHGVFNDLTGTRFGRLVVIDRAPNRGKHVYWLCRCDCGNETEVRGDALTRGPTVSCGCYQRDVATKHGLWQTTIYRLWRSMLNRCENPNCHAYELYGGRGIKVCERWHNVEMFVADMGQRPRGRSLDRINNDGDYEPENCRWATRKQQSRNRSDNTRITFEGETRCIAGWSEVTGINWSTIKDRLDRGWTVRDALTTPPDPSKQRKRQQQSA